MCPHAGQIEKSSGEAHAAQEVLEAQVRAQEAQRHAPFRYEQIRSDWARYSA